jgi:hypothetical protein
LSFETYPKPKEQIGPAIWNTLHEIASLYPDNPTRIDRMETKNIIKGIVNRGMPCKECVDDANQRFKNLDYTNRKTLYQSLCETHNDVNRKLGKPVVDCSSTLKLIEDCPTCSIPTVQKDDPVGLNINELKRSYQEIVKNMAIKEGVPVPEVIFGACPTDPRTSCALYDKNKIGPDGNYTGTDAKIYLNPYNASPRTVFHEMDHYIDLWKGRGHSLSEDKANDFAFSKLNEYFPIKNDPPVNMTGATDTVAVAADSGLYNWRQNYPMYQQIENRSFGQMPQPPPMVAAVPAAAAVPVNPDPNNDIVIQDDGIVKAFEGVSRLPAKWVGISPYDFVMTYVPEAITMTVKSVMGSNMTHFGNWFFSIILTAGLFTGSVLLNKSLAYGDRVFMQRITASMLSNVSNISNPKIRDGIVSGFGKFFEGITSGDLEGISESIIELPENSLISKWLNPNKTEFVSDTDALESTNAVLGDPTDLSMGSPLRKVRNAKVGGGFADGGAANGIDSIYYGQNMGQMDMNSDSIYDMY